MSDKENTQDLDQTKETQDIEQLVQQASDKLHIDIDWARSIKPEELRYLLDRCPFLQIVNTEITLQEKETQFHDAKSGWIIHDYGDALSSSLGQYLISGGDFQIYFGPEKTSKETKIINPGKGTLHKQAWDTAVQMIEIAREQGWRGIRIIDGHPLMKRAAWITVSEMGLMIEDFEPSEHDELVRSLVERPAAELDVLRKEIRLER